MGSPCSAKGKLGVDEGKEEGRGGMREYPLSANESTAVIVSTATTADSRGDCLARGGQGGGPTPPQRPCPAEIVFYQHLTRKNEGMQRTRRINTMIQKGKHD